MSDELLAARMRKNPPQCVEDLCMVAVRDAIAAGSILKEDQIDGAAAAICVGLFSKAWFDASEEQRGKWFSVTRDCYRKALGFAP